MGKVQTTAERAQSAMAAVQKSDKAQYTAGEVRHILNGLTQGGCKDGLHSVDRMKRGDVFIASAVGGKTRPWITLKVTGKIVVGVAMSSGDSAPEMTKSESRFWAGSWIGTAVSLFVHDTVKDKISLPYANDRHLREVEGRLANLISLRPLKGRGRSNA